MPRVRAHSPRSRVWRLFPGLHTKCCFVQHPTVAHRPPHLPPRSAPLSATQRAPMKKLFGRDKPKTPKPPGAKDIASPGLPQEVISPSPSPARTAPM